MPSWDGKERRSGSTGLDQLRKDMSDLKNEQIETRTDVRLLVNKVDANHESLRKTIARIEELIEKHNHTLYGNGSQGLTTRIKSLEDKKDDLRDHIISDRWAFGLILVVQTTILVKLFWPH